MCCMMLLVVCPLQFSFYYYPATDVFACVADMVGSQATPMLSIHRSAMKERTTVPFESHPTYLDPGTYIVHSMVAL